MKAAGRRTFEHALQAGDLDAFAALLTEQWQLKYDRSPSAIHDRSTAGSGAASRPAALGGKLVGAGGGGFLLFYADEKAELRAAMAGLGLEEVASASTTRAPR